LRHTGKERQIRWSAQFAEIEVAELAGQRVASPNEFREPDA
jgi:hypothetical protein